jgi:addiction module HigA family antidote
MIINYRDKRTRDFAAGKWVKAFSSIERATRLKIDRLEAATALRDLAALPGNRFEVLKGDRKGQYSIASTTNGGFALNGPKGRPDPTMWRSLIIIRRIAMAVPAIHPGEHLAEELKELDMSAAALARKLKVPTNRITGILNGQRAITGDTALRLAHFFGTSAEFWLNLQKLYELRLAEQKAGKTIKALPTLKNEHVHP